MKYKIGIVGLGVMGRNLLLIMERNGFPSRLKTTVPDAIIFWK